MALIDKPGIYLDISEKDYHADPVWMPSLSSSIAKIIYDQSPRHARYAHPRLRPPGPDEIEEVKRPMDIGSAIHKVILGRGRDIDWLQFDDYRKKEAQAARDATRAAGRIPILAPDADAVGELNAAAMDQLHTLGRGDIFSSCNTEVTLVWEEDGVWCRARLDALPKDVGEIVHLVLPELKTTAGSADAETWTGRCFETGNDIQAAFYRRGLKAVLPMLASITHEWIVLEQKPPFALNILTASGKVNFEADEIVEHAVKVWRQCMKSGEWPGYDGGIVDTTTWRSMQRELRNMALLQRLAEWQAP